MPIPRIDNTPHLRAMWYIKPESLCYWAYPMDCPICYCMASLPVQHQYIQIEMKHEHVNIR